MIMPPTLDMSGWEERAKILNIMNNYYEKLLK